MIANRFNPLGVASRTPAMRYVQDGLIALYDAIECEGFGVENPESTALVDLMGNFPDLPISRIQDNVAVIDNGLSYMKDAPFCSDWGVDHPYSVEILWRTSGYVTEDNFAFVFNESYPYRQDSNLLFPATYKLSGGYNKSWLATTAYTPTVQTGSLHTLSLLNGAQSSSDISLLLNASRLSTTVFRSTRITSYRKRISLAQQTRGYQVFYGSVRIYDRKLTDEEVAYNYTIDKERFGI